MSLLYTLLTLVVAAASTAGFVVWSSFNRLVALDTRCDTAFAEVDVHLKHRHNLIPGLVETVRGYATHEKDVLSEVAQARAGAVQAVSRDAQVEAEAALGSTLVNVLKIAENYPELQASSHFRGLRDELVDAENRITAARRFYNLAIDEYNATLRQFPGSFVARFRHLRLRKPYDLGIERVLIDEPLTIKF